MARTRYVLRFQTRCIIIDIFGQSANCFIPHFVLIITHLIGFKSLWFPTVAVHTDSWLLAVAFFHGAKLSRQDKKRLFEKCNELPSLYETITGKEKIVWAPKKLGSSNKRPVGKMGAVASQKVIIPIIHIIRLFLRHHQYAWKCLHDFSHNSCLRISTNPFCRCSIH